MHEGPRRERASRESPEHDERVRQNVREQLELRLMYAEAVSEKGEVPVERVMLYGTDLHARIFGFIAPRERDAEHPAWAQLAHDIAAAGSHADRLDTITRYYWQFAKENTDHHDDPFWPFRYDPPGEEGAVKLHFGSMQLTDTQSDDEPGLLSSERLDEMRSKLKAMFAEIKETYPRASEVRGASWLYGREAYRRLFPSSYTAELVPRKAKEFVGGGTWGQFRRKDGSVDPDARAAFIDNLRHLDLEDPHKVFPVETLMVRGPIEDFYREYGIK